MKLSQDQLITSYEIFLKNKIQETEQNIKPNQLLSFCFDLPDDFWGDNLPFLLKESKDGFYSCSNNEEILAIGNIFSIESEGIKRWNKIEEQFNKFPGQFFNSEETKFTDLPLFIAAIKFNDKKQSDEWSDFRNLEFYIPKFLIKTESENLICRFNVIITSAFSIDNSIVEFSNTLTKFFNVFHEDEETFNYKSNFDLIEEKIAWKVKIEKALSAIKNNSFSKIVLARKFSLETDRPIPVELLPGRLKKANPFANIFFIKKNDSAFLGASPEILIELKNQVIRTEAIAGSRKRGTTLEEDQQFADDLFNSDKERAEHNSVVNFLVANLTSLAKDVQYEKIPSIKKLTSIQHLFTEITAKLQSGSSFFSIVDKIFPTPAVCGYPKESAMRLISELEDFDRGLYAGLIGWVSPSSAKLIVAIRSALIKKNTIFVYAGCGIVEGSDPESEFAETETKFKTILSAFNEKN
ncbi:MAG: isochorismate synthase [Ignavibacteriaceae bacterium]|jgi:menaquinone-specific isochorismate synthase